MISQHAEISYYMRCERDDAMGCFVQQLVRCEDFFFDDKFESGGMIFVMIFEIEDIEFEYWDVGEVCVGTFEEVVEG